MASSKAAVAASSDVPKINPDYTCFKIKLAKSKIHRWGLYAGEPMPAGRKVIEYTGERISRRETKRLAYLAIPGPTRD